MGLRETLHREPLSNLTMRPAVIVNASCTVREAVRQMCGKSVGAVIVVDGQGLPIGMFNEKMLVRFLAERHAALEEPIDSHMSARIVCLSRKESIARLIATMQENNLRWVCVVDEGGLPVALTGLRGVIEYVVECFATLVKVEPIESRLSMQAREGA